MEVTPGWSVAALEYLSRMRKIAAIGHETLNTDAGPEAAEAGDLVAQRFWLNENKYQVEVMANLDQVPATGAVIMINVLHIKALWLSPPKSPPSSTHKNKAIVLAWAIAFSLP